MYITTSYYSNWQFNVFSLENDIVLESERQLRICTFGLSYKNILVLLDIGSDVCEELHTISEDLVFVINGKILDVSVYMLANINRQFLVIENEKKNIVSWTHVILA